MADDQVPPPPTPSEPAPIETAQMPANEPLSEPISEPTPEASANTSSEPAKPVSEVAESAPEPADEASVAKVEPTPSNVDAAAASTPAPAATNTLERNRELLKKANAKRQTKKQANLDKIIAELEKRGKITNDEVEKLLHCSDATASRYLLELVKQGKIKKVGTTGAGVVYMKI